MNFKVSAGLVLALLILNLNPSVSRQDKVDKDSIVGLPVLGFKVGLVKKLPILELKRADSVDDTESPEKKSTARTEDTPKRKTVPSTATAAKPAGSQEGEPGEKPIPPKCTPVQRYITRTYTYSYRTRSGRVRTFVEKRTFRVRIRYVVRWYRSRGKIRYRRSAYFQFPFRSKYSANYRRRYGETNPIKKITAKADLDKYCLETERNGKLSEDRFKKKYPNSYTRSLTFSQWKLSYMDGKEAAEEEEEQALLTRMEASEVVKYFIDTESESEEEMEETEPDEGNPPEVPQGGVFEEILSVVSEEEGEFGEEINRSEDDKAESQTETDQTGSGVAEDANTRNTENNSSDTAKTSSKEGVSNGTENGAGGISSNNANTTSEKGSESSTSSSSTATDQSKIGSTGNGTSTQQNNTGSGTEKQLNESKGMVVTTTQTETGDSTSTSNHTSTGNDNETATTETEEVSKSKTSEKSSTSASTSAAGQGNNNSTTAQSEGLAKSLNSTSESGLTDSKTSSSDSEDSTTKQSSTSVSQSKESTAETSKSTMTTTSKDETNSENSTNTGISAKNGRSFDLGSEKHSGTSNNSSSSTSMTNENATEDTSAEIKERSKALEILIRRIIKDSLKNSTTGTKNVTTDSEQTAADTETSTDVTENRTELSETSENRKQKNRKNRNKKKKIKNKKVKPDVTDVGKEGEITEYREDDGQQESGSGNQETGEWLTSDEEGRASGQKRKVVSKGKMARRNRYRRPVEYVIVRPVPGIRRKSGLTSDQSYRTRGRVRNKYVNVGRRSKRPIYVEPQYNYYDDYLETEGDEVVEDTSSSRSRNAGDGKKKSRRVEIDDKDAAENDWNHKTSDGSGISTEETGSTDEFVYEYTEEMVDPTTSDNKKTQKTIEKSEKDMKKLKVTQSKNNKSSKGGEPSSGKSSSKGNNGSTKSNSKGEGSRGKTRITKRRKTQKSWRSRKGKVDDGGTRNKTAVFAQARAVTY